MSICMTLLKSITYDKSMCIHGKTVFHALYHSAYTLFSLTLLECHRSKKINQTKLEIKVVIHNISNIFLFDYKKGNEKGHYIKTLRREARFINLGRTSVLLSKTMAHIFYNNLKLQITCACVIINDINKNY